jgi:hypothetical protein
MAVNDYDAPRGNTVELEQDSLEELRTRRTATQSPSVDVDDTEIAESFELPGAEQIDEELTVPVVPLRTDEFRCSSCFLVHHHNQWSGQRGGQDICRECS